MKLFHYVTILSLFGTTIADALGQPAPNARLDGREEDQHLNDLFKRKGGGGGGGRGGGGGGGRSGGSGSRGSGSSRTSPGTSGGSSGGRSGGSSGSGGGSGTSRSFGGGKYYGGGATTPYKAGSPSPKGVPGRLLAAGAVGLAVWGGLWLTGAYLYDFDRPYRFYNETSNQDETLDVICGCSAEVDALCGCEQNDDDDYLDDLVGDGSYATLQENDLQVAVVDGDRTLLINGTLDPDTTAPGEGAAFGSRNALEALGYWPVVAVVLGSIFMA